MSTTSPSLPSRIKNPRSLFSPISITPIRVFSLALLLVLGSALYLRAPFVSSGLPYFADEDEGHHFNRIVEMVKDERLNPGYFLKPTLHFYLRMPVVAASFLWEVRKGHIRSTNEIRTRDPHGLSGYAFTASHPSIVKWNRAFSLLLGLGSILIAMVLTFHLTRRASAATLAGLVLAVSPPLVAGNATIGVDVVVTFFAIASLALAIAYLKHASFLRLVLLGLCCGLTVSSKYNAAPIAVLPLLAVLFRPDFRFSSMLSPWGHVIAACALPAIGFVLGTPYCLITPGLFIDHVASEVFHYSVSGHAGHMANPGFAQVIHYGNWFAKEALGWPFLILALAGIVSAAKRNSKLAALLFTFPALYFVLMINQKANFVRNMHILLPFLAIAIGISVAYITAQAEAFKRPALTRTVQVLLVVALAPQFWMALTKHANAARFSDSREELRTWLRTNHLPEGDYAASGKLQMLGLSTVLNTTIFDPKKVDEKDLWLAGFKGFISEPYTRLRSDLGLSKEIFTAGVDSTAARIVSNPKLAVRLYQDDILFSPTLLSELPLVQVHESSENAGFLAADSKRWLQTKVVVLKVHGASKNGAAKSGTLSANRSVTVNFFSPWIGQELRAYVRHAQGLREVGMLTWANAGIQSMQLPLSGTPSPFVITTKIIRSPAQAGMNKDTRRLSVELQP